MFKRIQSKITFSYFLVLLSCFLITLITTSLFIHKTYFSYALKDLKNDAGLFVDVFTKEAIVNKDTVLLQKIVTKSEEDYIIDIFDQQGVLLATSKAESLLSSQAIDEDEFKISPSKGYGYALRQGDDGVKTVYVAIAITVENKGIGFIRISTPVLYIEKTINRLQLYVMLIFVLGMAGAFIISFFLSRGISSPLSAMTEVAREISSGNLKRQVDIKSRSDEIGILVSAFNNMIMKLKSVQQERKNILSNISHELLTPITTIRGFVETLYDDKVQDKEGVQECLEVIKRESDYLEGLIGELRFISQIDAFAVKYDFKSLKIADTILEAEKSLSSKAAEKNITIRNDFINDYPYIRGDANALRQVFINLLDNAIKYSHKDKTIFISVGRADKLLKVMIKDQGIGVDPKEQEKIFERFYRVKHALSLQKGIGLGLAIVKEILDAHQAGIIVESQGNKGSQFIVTFPLS